MRNSFVHEEFPGGGGEFKLTWKEFSAALWRAGVKAINEWRQVDQGRWLDPGGHVTVGEYFKSNFLFFLNLIYF